jgi:hypothetical protein
VISICRFSVSWCSQDGDKLIRHTLFSYNSDSCIDAARLILGYPYVFEVEVTEVDSGKAVPWQPSGIDQVISE